MIPGEKILGKQGHVELFDLSDSSLDDQAYEEVALTPQALVSEDWDVTNANMHTGSQDIRRIDRGEGAAEATIQGEEELAIQILRVTVDAAAQAQAAQTDGAMRGVVQLNLGDILEGAPEGATVILHGFRQDGRPKGEAGSDIRLDPAQAETLYIRIPEGGAGPIEFQVEIAPPPDVVSDATRRDSLGEETDAATRFDDGASVAADSESSGAPSGDTSISSDGDGTPNLPPAPPPAATPETVSSPGPENTAEAPTLTIQAARGDEDTAIPLHIETQLTDTDGSETLSVTIANVPEGAALSAGVDQGDGVWLLNPAELEDLTLTPPQDFFGTIDLDVTATATERNGGAEASTGDLLSITVDDVIDRGSMTGTPRADSLTGTDGHDHIEGLGRNDTLRGQDGSDLLDGGSGDDKLYGGSGDDVLTGGKGRDVLDGGSGDDTFVLNRAHDVNDTLKGGAGTDTVVADDGGDITFNRFAGNNSIEVVDGGDEASRIVGTSKADSLDFRNAELRNIDGIDAGRGNDSVYGSHGDDVIAGGQGRDTLHGESGDDALDGGTGDDKLYGGAGDDVLTGGKGRDVLDGGSGDDTFVLNRTHDVNDTLKGGAGTDTVVADDGGDIAFNRFAGNNSIEVVDGGDEASRIVGTAKADSLDFRNAELRNIDGIDTGRGNDSVYGSHGDDVISGGQGRDTLRGESGDDALDGGSGDDKLYGGAGDDVLTGGKGRDVLDGGSGDDTFVLNRTHDLNDTLKGGAGTDTVVADDGGDIAFNRFAGNNSIEVVDGGDEASRIVGTSKADSLDFRNAELRNIDGIDTGRGNDSVYGSQGDDVISGGGGRDTLRGESGDDVLSGGAGDDKLYGGAGDDVFIFGEGGGHDRASGGSGWLDTVRLENADGDAPDAGSWSLTLRSGSIEEEAEGYIALSQDAAGTIQMDDGSQLVFDGVDRIEW